MPRYASIMDATSDDLADILRLSYPISSMRRTWTDGAFHHGGRRRPSVLLQEVLLQGTRIDPDADSNVSRLGRLDDGTDSRSIRIARIDANPVGAVAHGRKGQTVVEVNVRNEGDMDLLPDGLDGRSGSLIPDGHADDLAAGPFQAPDLGKRFSPTSRVSVDVMDWTTTGAPPPICTPPTNTGLVFFLLICRSTWGRLRKGARPPQGRGRA